MDNIYIIRLRRQSINYSISSGKPDVCIWPMCAEDPSWLNHFYVVRSLMWADHPSMLVALCDSNSNKLVMFCTFTWDYTLWYPLLLLHLFILHTVNCYIYCFHLLSFLLINCIVYYNPSVKPEDGSIQANRP